MKTHAMSAAIVVILAGCGGGFSLNPSGNSGTGSGGGGGTSAMLAVNPTSLSFASGQSSAQSFTLSGGHGTVSYTSSCSGVASVQGGGGALPVTYTVTPQAPGSCSIRFTDTYGDSAAEAISVGGGSTGGGGSSSFYPGTLNFTYEADHGDPDAQLVVQNPNAQLADYEFQLVGCSNVNDSNHECAPNWFRVGLGIPAGGSYSFTLLSADGKNYPTYQKIQYYCCWTQPPAQWPQ